MDRKTFYITDTTGAANKLTIFPTYDFAEDLTDVRADHRSLGGKLNSYKLLGHQYRYSIPLTNISSEDRIQINSWWTSQSEIIFTFGNTSTNELESVYCKIKNQSNPLNIRTNIQFTEFSGYLRLNSTRGIKTATAIFILDDSYLGKIDGEYNLLA